MFLIVTRNFPPDIGGIQVLMGGLSESLLDHGPVKIFADAFDDSQLYDSKTAANVTRVKGIKLFKKFRKANLVNDFIEQNSNIRAIITDHWKSLELLKKEYLKKTKVMCLIHSKEINHEINSSLNKRLIKSLDKADFIVSNSNFTKNLAIRAGVNRSKVNIIFPGIQKPKIVKDLFKIEAQNIFKEAFPKIITVARLDARKGHDKILMLIKNLKPRFPKIKYVSIGSGKEKNNLQKLTKELSITNDVTFLENLDENLKLSLISQSNLFLMPSRIEGKSVEGFGISFLEAASYGIASIGGKDGGESDAIIHNKTGLICDGNDLNSIYESVINLLSNNKFNQFGKNALKFSEDFHWNKVVKNYLKLIN
jgi:phosphatidylinositol alpha-1,6-mannosyltransferase